MINDEGEFYWISHELKKSSKIYPHIEELKSYVLSYKTEFERLTKNSNKFLKENNTLKKIFSNCKNENFGEIMNKEMLRFTEWFLPNYNKKEYQITKSLKSSFPMQTSMNDERRTISKSGLITQSRNNMDSKQNIADPVYIADMYDATPFASLLGLPNDILNSDEILNLILYCSFNLEINCK